MYRFDCCRMLPDMSAELVNVHVMTLQVGWCVLVLASVNSTHHVCHQLPLPWHHLSVLIAKQVRAFAMINNIITPLHSHNFPHFLQAGCPSCRPTNSVKALKAVGVWWRWPLVSPDGVVPSRMVVLSASVNLSLHHKVQKSSSGTGSPSWSQKKGRKTVVVWCGVLV